MQLTYRITLFLILFSWGATGTASTIKYDPETNLITGLTNVSVAGANYNVIFSADSFYGAFGIDTAPPSMFDFSSSSVSTQSITLNADKWLFAQALVDLFNSELFRHVRGNP